MAISGISAGAGFAAQGLGQLQGLQNGGPQLAQGPAAPANPPANPQSFNVQAPPKPATGTQSGEGTVQEVSTGPARPGQAGAGIGDLQSVAPSSISRGQIVDISA